MILILLTVFMGDDVAQGFMHFAAGIIVFAIALVLIFALDSLISAWSGRGNSRDQPPRFHDRRGLCSGRGRGVCAEAQAHGFA